MDFTTVSGRLIAACTLVDPTDPNLEPLWGAPVERHGRYGAEALTMLYRHTTGYLVEVVEVVGPTRPRSRFSSWSTMEDGVSDAPEGGPGHTGWNLTEAGPELVFAERARPRISEGQVFSGGRLTGGQLTFARVWVAYLDEPDLVGCGTPQILNVQDPWTLWSARVLDHETFEASRLDKRQPR